MRAVLISLKVLFALNLCCFFILVHECGHYVCAHVCGIGVESVKIGSGRTLIEVKLPDGAPLSLHILPFSGSVTLVAKDIIDAHYSIPPLKMLALTASGMIATAIVAAFLMAMFVWMAESFRSPGRAIAYGCYKALIGLVTFPFRLAQAVMTFRSLETLRDSHTFALLMSFIGESKPNCIYFRNKKITTDSAPLLWLGGAAAIVQLMTWYVLVGTLSERSDAWKMINYGVACLIQTPSTISEAVAMTVMGTGFCLVIGFSFQVLAQVWAATRSRH